VKFRFSIQRAILLLAVATSLGACTSAGRWEEPETPPATVVKPDTSAGKSPAAAGELPRSKYGNPPFYEVYGVRYTILPGSSGYREEGVASWYGRKFHGRRTSSGEPYDMYKMSAAHTTLPLPTNARVTNLQNGKSVIVRINDRGPFAKDRLIDLSYAAAVELDMITNGTARVEVVALDGLQVGAFGARGNAEQLESRLNASGISNTRVHLTPGESPAMYRVRIGPMFTIEEYDKMVQRVSLMQITDTQLVIETVGAKHPSRDAAFASR
jgi:rare lipoprotein A